MTEKDREQFDKLLEEILAELPAFVRRQLDELPLIVEDEPSPAILQQMKMTPEDEDDLLGLHSGIPLTERSPTTPLTQSSSIHIFRGPISRFTDGSTEELKIQIRITLLHEIGHHFGFSEEDLEKMGYQ